ncbi:MAG TPA: Bax inhibitor-1/YccA family protein [Clostridia bacterium]|nr:Bax inhibitor-1/YccA family protein [Clostridia bacterium]
MGHVFDPDGPMPGEALSYEMEEVEREQRALLVKVYGFMAVGLLISAAVARWAMARPEMFTYVHEHALSFQIIFALEVAAVAIISQVIENIPIGLAALIFVCYAAFNGISFAVFFLFIPPGAVAFGFLIAALTFAAMAAYGRMSGADLGTMGSTLITLVAGLGIMSAANVVFNNERVYWATSYLGVIVFASLASYHAQDFRDFDWAFEDDDEANNKAALTGALLLYLDFVNLYIMFMRLIGRGRDRR